MAQEQVTLILQDMQAGKASAAERLLPLVYDELRALAAAFFRQERPNHTLQPTALVHEAYMKLVGVNEVPWTGRAHFFAVAAHAMRRILINHAEARNALKRCGGRQRVAVTDDTPAPHRAFADLDLHALDEALTRLEALDQRQCRVVELRFFAGMSVEEVATVLGVSTRLVKLDWQMARAWLFTQLNG